MKILKLTQAVKAAITEQRDKVSAALKKLTSSSAAYAKLEKQEAQLAGEIIGLESADPSSAAARALSEKRAELELVKRRISELPSSDTEAEHRFHTLLRESSFLAQKTLAPTYEDYVEGVADKLLPYCLDFAHARSLASQTAAAASLAGRTHRLHVGSAFVAEAKRIISELEEILTGELNWSFTPKS